jgi:bifunctional UDP-N-acetylglucosamine pyrophosphorylase / glucosamine-1-phosphate N-acetyltransferase
MKIYSQEEIRSLFKAKIDPSLWTAIIPAAGQGTRLGYSRPKILYPIAGKPILDWLINLLSPQCKKLIFVLSSKNAFHVAPILKKKLSNQSRVVIINNSRGMADSIYQAVPKLSTPYVLIIWGDQVAISPKTILSIQKIHQSVPEANLTLPLIQKKDPYSHYIVDENNRLIKILEKREDALMPTIGESDCGVFACSTVKLRKIFQSEIDKGISFSRITREWNFLPLLPNFEGNFGNVNAFRLENIEESIGINNVNDASILEKYLKKYEQSNNQA